jgi:hypothetical protein
MFTVSVPRFASEPPQTYSVYQGLDSIMAL